MGSVKAEETSCFTVMNSNRSAELEKNDEPEDVVPQQHIIQRFQKKFIEIECFLEKNQQLIAKDPVVLKEFVDQRLMSVWSSELTIKAILGVKRWKQLSEVRKTELLTAYQDTMHRYLFEMMARYDGQKAIAADVELNQKQTKGWLNVDLQIDNFPDLAVDLKIYRNQDKWQIYDFRFQGISFVKMKQSEYQGIYDEKGVDELVRLLSQKNKAFIEATRNISE